MYICAVDEDREQARQIARRQLSFFVVDGASKSFYEREGFGAAAEQIVAAWRAGDLQGMAAAVNDEMLDTFLLAGEPAEVRARVAELGDLVDHAILHPVTFGMDEAQIVAGHDAIIATFS